MKIDNIKKVMLGHQVDDVELVIITPLKSTFRKLKEQLKIEEIYESAFFENCIFKITKNSKKGIIILSPQGIAAKDIVELFENTKILFFGLAGSLNSRLEIGSFVEVETAINGKEKIKLTTTGNFMTVQCGYSPCLIGKMAKEYCEISRKQNCNVVDMETVICAKTAVETNNQFIALLLISDIPEIINFWEVPENMQIKLGESRKKAIGKIVNYINVLAGKE